MDGKLVQTPLPAIRELREAEIPADGHLPAACELEIACPDGNFDLNLFTRADGSGGLRLRYDAERKVCTLDRSQMDKRFNTQVGEVLELPLEGPARTIDIFIDRCSAELFFNGGEATFTTHVYPTEREFNYAASDGVGIRVYPMKASVTDDFVV